MFSRPFAVMLISLLGSASFCAAQRKPLGVCAKIDLPTLIKNYKGNPALLRNHLQGVYQDLFTNPAISGISIGVRWDQISLSVLKTTPFSTHWVFGGNDWTLLDDLFEVARLNHSPLN